MPEGENEKSGEYVKTTEGSRLLKLVEEFDQDNQKFNEKGNQSAGVRARKKLMELRRVATEIKAEMLAKPGGDGKD